MLVGWVLGWFALIQCSIFGGSCSSWLRPAKENHSQCHWETWETKRTWQPTGEGQEAVAYSRSAKLQPYWVMKMSARLTRGCWRFFLWLFIKIDVFYGPSSLSAQQLCTLDCWDPLISGRQPHGFLKGMSLCVFVHQLRAWTQILFSSSNRY